MTKKYAEVKKGFACQVNEETVWFNVGDQLDFIQTANDESGEIRYAGENICFNHSPFARDHFNIIDESDTTEKPNPKILTNFKAKSIQPITTDYNGNPVNIQIGEYLDMVEGPATDVFVIQKDGVDICLSSSRIARKSFEILPVDEPFSERTIPNPRLDYLRETLANAEISDLFTQVTKSDAEWLIERAAKADEYERTLKRIRDADVTRHNTVDTVYWAVLALGEDD